MESGKEWAEVNERSDDDKVVLTVGSAGKSTLLNCLDEAKLFNGVSRLTEMTYQSDEKIYRGRQFLDTHVKLISALTRQERYRDFLVPAS